MKLLTNLLYIILSSVFASNLFGAACCGGGLVNTFLITGDDKAQINSSYTFNKINVDIDQNGYWREREFSENIESFKLEGAHIFLDRFQGGVSIPIIKRSRLGQSSAGIGDITATLGYEYLPDWNYNPLRPKGIGYINLIMPTGVSLGEATENFLLDARGRGFWTLGVGTFLTKTFGSFDFFSDLGIHRSFNQSYEKEVTLIPGWGENISFGGGINFSKLRLGASIAWVFEDPILVRGKTNSEGSLQRYTSLDFPVTYFFSNEWLVVAKYSDKGLIGSPLNTSLDKSFTFQIQRKWPR